MSVRVLLLFGNGTGSLSWHLMDQLKPQQLFRWWHKVSGKIHIAEHPEDWAVLISELLKWAPSSGQVFVYMDHVRFIRFPYELRICLLSVQIAISLSMCSLPSLTDFCQNGNWAHRWCFPVAQLVEHGTSNAKIMGSIPRESKSW